MPAFANRTFLAPLLIAAVAAPALAAGPRGMRLLADEQIADEATGTTIARGRAEISIDHRNIRGTADAIEVRPGIDEVFLRGHAQITIGRAHYQSDMLSCTLNFMRCVIVDDTQPLPASAVPAPVSAAGAVTSPR